MSMIMAKQWWVKIAGIVQGPYSTSQIRELATLGKLQLQSLLSVDQVTWVPAKSVKGLDLAPPSSNISMAQFLEEELESITSDPSHGDYAVSNPLPRLPPMPGSDASLPCPSCMNSLPADAVLCIHCGYDRRTGRVLQTEGPSTTKMGSGHIKVASPLNLSKPLRVATSAGMILCMAALGGVVYLFFGDNRPENVAKQDGPSSIRLPKSGDKIAGAEKKSRSQDSGTPSNAADTVTKDSHESPALPVPSASATSTVVQPIVAEPAEKSPKTPLPVVTPPGFGMLAPVVQSTGTHASVPAGDQKVKLIVYSVRRMGRKWEILFSLENLTMSALTFPAEAILVDSRGTEHPMNANEGSFNVPKGFAWTMMQDRIKEISMPTPDSSAHPPKITLSFPVSPGTTPAYFRISREVAAFDLTTLVPASASAQLPPEQPASPLPPEQPASSTAVHEDTIYCFQPEHTTSGVSRNLKVTQDREGNTTATALSDGATVALATDTSNQVAVPDAPGSINLQVNVNPRVGQVKLAGLRFRSNVRVDIRDDGMVLVDREKLRVQGVDGSWYVSRKETVDGQSVIVFIRDAASEKGTRSAGTGKPADKSRSTFDGASNNPTEAVDAGDEVQVRSWTDLSGRTVQAKFEGLDDGKVRLRKVDGTVLKVSEERLSEVDQEWVKRKIGSRPSTVELYYFRPKFTNGTPSRKVKLCESQRGAVEISVLGDGGIIGYGESGPGVRVYGADALLLGSTGLVITIDPAVGYTTVAGLRFQDEATVDLAPDGVVVVSRTGVRASDADGGRYISRKRTIDGRTAIVMVESNSGTGAKSVGSSKSVTKRNKKDDSGKPSHGDQTDRESAATEKAIAEIEKLGGKIGRDENDPRKPVVMVLLACDVTNAGLVSLKGIPQLKTLIVRAHSVTDAGLVHIKTLKQLQSLELCCPWITDAGLMQLKGLRQLETLKLSCLQVTNAGLVHLIGFSRLRTLELFCQITDAGLGYIKGLNQLQELQIHSSLVTDAGLVHLKRLTQLHTLNLFGTSVTGTGVAELQKALPNVQIRH